MFIFGTFVLSDFVGKSYKFIKDTKKYNLVGLAKLKKKNLRKKYQYKKAHTLKREENRVNIYKRTRKHIQMVFSHIIYSI